MMWLWLTIGLIVGTMAGWLLCALCTVGVHHDQIEKIGRMRYVIRSFLTRTDRYHDDHILAEIRNFAQDLLSEQD